MENHLRILLREINLLSKKQRLEMIQALELGNDDNSPLEKILNVVSEHLNIGTKEILSKSRIKEIAFARHVSMYFARRKTKLSLNVIGAFYGDRDHATVLNSHYKICKMIDTQESIKKLVKLMSLELHDMPDIKSPRTHKTSR